MTTRTHLPLAVQMGVEHVSVAQCSSGWAAMVWRDETGPQMLFKPTDYGKAISEARGYAHRSGAVLDLPDAFGLIHVRRTDNNWLEVLHESRSGESFATLALFPPHDRDAAVRFALRRLHVHAPCILGDVASWDF